MADRPVVAAGAVVWRRRRNGELEFCIIHRPHRQDWSLPKGKQNDGEHLLATAVREIAEETGHHVNLGRPLPTQRYTVNGRPKVVRYWAAEADDQPDEREPNEEVDEVVFLSASDAIARLTYTHDRQLLQSVVSGPARTSPLVVLRHAHSLERATWEEEDDERPLDDRGREQAKALVQPLNAFGIERAVSSPAVRCVDTLRPWAEDGLVSIKLDSRLAEGRPSSEVDDAASELTDAATVVCTHRPVLPGLLTAIEPSVQTDPPLAKGEFVVIHRDSRGVVAIELHGV